MPRFALPCVLVLASCAPSSAPAIDVPSSSIEDTAAAATVASVASPPATAPSVDPNPYQDPDFPNFLGTCRQSGLRALEPCPAGGTPKIDEVDQPEIMRYCCASGALSRYPQMEGCFNVLEAAISCGDAGGIQAARARISELVKVSGEPCKDPAFRERFTDWPGLRRVCTLRGFP